MAKKEKKKDQCVVCEDEEACEPIDCDELLEKVRG